MADTKISGLAQLTGAPDNLDLLVIVDVSDTSMAATGTDKRILVSDFALHPAVAWTDYTPTLVQSVTVTKTVTYARYMRIGRLIVGQAKLDVTGAGTAANPIQVGLPVASVNFSNAIYGGFGVYDSSAVTWYNGPAYESTSTIIVGISPSTGGAIGAIAPMSAALASGDIVTCSFMYEAAA